MSDNHHGTVEFVLDVFDLRSAFDTYYGREKTVESLRLKKPKPHYLERALTDLAPESALYVGDSASDVRAADRGLDSALVRRPHCRGLDRIDPTHEADDLRDVARIVAGRDE